MNMAVWTKKVLGVAFSLLLVLSAIGVKADRRMIVTSTELISVNYNIPPGTQTRRRYIDPQLVEQVTSEFKQIDKPNTSQTLQGSHKFQVKVINARTGAPVPRYHLQAVITLSRPGENKIANLENDPKIEKISKLPCREVYCIGQLESQEVDDSNGTTRYERLGTIELEIQAEAEGFLSNSEFIRIPNQGKSLTLRLTPAATLKGQLVEAGSGKPLAGQEVGLVPPNEEDREHFGFPIRPSHRATTDANGHFTLTGLPPARFQLYLPAAARSRGDLSDRLGGMLLEEGQDSGSAPAPQKLERRLAEVQVERLPLPDQKTIIDLTTGGTIDAGKIKIQLTPLVELELASSQGTPMSNYPYEFEYLDGPSRSSMEKMKGRTDAAGKARFPLVGWKPGIGVAIYVPGKMEDIYQVRAVEKANPNPLTSTDEGDYYRCRFFEGEMGYHMLIHFWGVREGDHFPRWDEMTRDQKKRFRTAFKDKIAELRAQAAKLAARPTHPNYRLLKPKPGETLLVKMKLQHASNEVTLNLRFVDKETSQPLREISGCVSELELSRQLGNNAQFFQSQLNENPDAYRTFQATGSNGKINVQSLTLSARFLETELDKSKTNLTYESKVGPRLYVVAKSPGYIDQMFELPAAEIRSGREHVLALEPEAIVRGRVVRADGSPLGSTVRLNFTNWGMEVTDSPATPEHFPSYQRGKLDAGGHFELRGMRPHPNWSCEIEGGSDVPARTFRNIAIKRGVNDLGDLRYLTSGTLSGQVKDETGKGIANVQFKFPCESDSSSESPKEIRTNAAGFYRSSLILKNSRQIVRIVPPWAAEIRERQINDRSIGHTEAEPIVFDSIREIDLGSSQTLNTRLDRGHTLIVEIPSSPLRDKLLRYYSDPHNTWVDFSPAKDDPVHFTVAGAAIQALEPTPGGFIYMQRQLLSDRVSMTSGTITLRLDHVPAGRHALRVDGGYYYDKRRDNQGSQYKQSQLFDDNTTAIAWTEFEMLATTTTIQVAFNATNVIVDLKGIPSRLDDSDVLPAVFLECEQPLSTIHGEDIHRLMVTDMHVFRGIPSQYLTPMMGRYLSFCRFDEKGRFQGYRPALLQSVPPGRYQLRAYPSIYTLRNLAARPYYETTVDVGFNTGEIRLSIPMPGEQH